MAKHTFSVTFTGSSDDTLDKARRALAKEGGAVEGDGSKGTLLAVTPAGKVKGTYRVEGQTLTIEVTDKPFIVPASAIEAQVRKFLGGG